MKNVLFCRIYQAVMYVAAAFLPWREPKLLKGEGSFSQLPEELKRNGTTSVLIVSGKKHTRLLIEPLLGELKKEGVKYTLFDEVSPDPTIKTVEAALEQYRRGDCQAIIAVGGGSPMDCAKAVGARVARPNKTLRQMKGVLKIGKKIPPLYAVPTTSGTGSEVTLAAVVTDDETHFKYAINDPALIPYAAVLDPILTVGLPSKITAETGMDALCHAVETYIGGANTPSTKKNAKEAILLIKENLLKAYSDGNDLAARENMQKAAYLAGLAFTRAYVGYVHAIAHTLGGKYHISHGLANAIIMPYVFEAYGKKAQKKLAELSDLLELTEKDASKKRKAESFIDWIRQLNSKTGIGDGFEEIRENDVDEMAERAEKEGNPLYPVPKIMGKEELKEIYRKMMR